MAIGRGRSALDDKRIGGGKSAARAAMTIAATGVPSPRVATGVEFTGGVCPRERRRIWQPT